MTQPRHKGATSKQNAEAERWGLAQSEKLLKEFDKIGRFTFRLVDAIGVDGRKTVRSQKGNLSDVILSEKLSYVNPDTRAAYGIRLGVASMHQLIRWPHVPPHTFLGVATILSAESGTPQTMSLRVGEFVGAFTLHHPTLPYHQDGDAECQDKLERYTSIVGLVEQLLVGKLPFELASEFAPQSYQLPVNPAVPSIDMYM